MNFLSQALSNLTSGGKLYIFFQLIYITGALFFTYVQWQILNQLTKSEVTICKPDARYYTVTYSAEEHAGRLQVFANSKDAAANHVKSIYRNSVIMKVE